MSVINVTGLTKSYADVVALDGFDLEVKPGRIVGLIGQSIARVVPRRRAV